jgi:hypothetical protein
MNQAYATVCFGGRKLSLLEGLDFLLAERLTVISPQN